MTNMSKRFCESWEVESALNKSESLGIPGKAATGPVDPEND